MKRKLNLLLLTLAAAVLLMCTLLFSASAAVSGNYTYTVYSDGVSITECNKAVSGAVTVPSTLGGYPVMEIGADAFNGCALITEITVPAGVESILDRAFYACTMLEKLSVPSTINYVGEDILVDTAYYYNDANWADGLLYAGRAVVDARDYITSVTNMKQGTLVIAEAVFSECSELTSVNVAGGVEYICPRAFEDCTALGEITLPDTIKRIGYYAFSNTKYYQDENNWADDGCLYIGKCLIEASAGIGTLVIREGTVCLADDAMYDLPFTSVRLPASLKYIGNSFYYNCANQAFTVASGNADLCAVDGVLYSKDMTRLLCFPIGKQVSSFTVPSSVKVIGEYAFTECVQLKSVTLPAGLTEISYNAFNYCGITSISLPSSLRILSNRAFCGTAISSVTIPSGIKTIGIGTFESCESLRSVKLPQGLDTICGGAFSNCKNLESISLPSSVTYIGEEAFGFCSKLTSISIPDTISFIGADAFCDTPYLDDRDGILYVGKLLVKAPEELTGEVTVSDKTTAICDNAFYECYGITKIVLPESVTEIGKSAFDSCSALMTVTGLNNVKHIGSEAFLYCEKLSSSELGAVNYLGLGAFDGCSSLTSFSVACESEYYACADGILYDKSFKYLICCPMSYAPDKLTVASTVIAIGKNAFFGNTAGQIILPEGLLSLGDCSFERADNITGVNIPSTLKFIGESAFYRSDSFETANIPSGVKEIGIYAFGSCDVKNVTLNTGLREISRGAFRNTGIKSIVIPDTVISIGKYAFCECDALTSLTIPSLIKSIRAYTFQDCTRLASVQLPAQLSYIGDSAFNYCIKLSSVDIPATVISIGEYAFYSCQELAGVVFDADSILETIDYGAFNDCVKLASVVIPRCVKNIGGSAFYNCSALASVTINAPDAMIGIDAFGLTKLKSDSRSSEDLYIGNYLIALNDSTVSAYSIKDGTTSVAGGAFKDMSELLSVTVPESLKTIGECAFSSCGLQSFTGKAGIERMGDSVFSNCTALKSVNLCSALTKLPAETFYNCEALMNAVLNGTEAIGEYAFYSCDALKSITLPDSLRTIDSMAFSASGLVSLRLPKMLESICENSFECPALETITVDGNNTSYTVVNGMLYDISKKSLLICPAALSGNLSVPSGTVYIGSSAFKYCEKLTDIVLPASVSYIGGSFYDCTALTSLRVSGNNMIYCSENGVLYDKNQTEVIAIPAMCTSLNLPSSVFYFYGDALSADAKLKTISIPNKDFLTYCLYQIITSDIKVYAPSDSPVLEYCTTNDLECMAAPVPAAVSGVSVTALSTSSVRLTWEAVSGAAGYDIFRYNSATRTYDYYKSVGAVTSFTDTGLKAYSRYYYKVRACTSPESEVKMLGDLSAFAACNTKIASPVLKWANVSSSSVRLSWSAVSNANGYYIYRSTNKTSGFRYVRTVTTAYYTDTALTPGTVYYYRVVARCATAGCNSAYSTVISAKPVPTAPVSLTCTARSAVSLRLTWRAVSGATGYQVYKYNSTKRAYVYYRTVATNSFTDSKLSANSKYYYKVRAYVKRADGKYAYGSLSGFYTTYTRVATPALKAVRLSKTSAKLTWTRVSGAKNYLIYRSTSRTGGFTRIATLSASASAYTNRSLSSGRVYYYRIVALSSRGGAYNSTYRQVYIR